MDPREGKWQQEPDMLYHRAYAASAFGGDCIFVAGGNFGMQFFNTVEMFDLRKPVWRMLPSLNVARNGAGLALVGDSLYAIGGFDGRSENLRVTEKLDMTKDLRTQEWEVCEETLHARDGSVVEVLTSTTESWKR
uniref:Kelch repeat protein n=1 Tax=Hanusia phi TaxID=3032 RepID=A0A7S0I0X0_9CRYP